MEYVNKALVMNVRLDHMYLFILQANITLVCAIKCNQ